MLFLFQSSVPLVFSSLHGSSIFQTGRIQLASYRAIVAAILNSLQDRLYVNSALRNLARPGNPEARLYFSVPGSLLFFVGMFWYVWASWPNLP